MTKKNNNNENGKPTNDQVSEFKKDLAKKRERITLLYSPIRTFVLLIKVLFSYCVHLISVIMHSKIVWTLILTLGGVYTSLVFTESHWVDDIHTYSKFFIWWFGLGVLSSVGLGSGMHSGILFLFPHMFRVVSSAKHCPNMDFVSSCDMWWHECPMNCLSDLVPGQPEEAAFLDCLFRVAIPAFFWGAGTAAGEIPPYAVSRAAALAGESNDDTPDISEEIEGADVISKMKAWMVDFVEKYGFWGVLLMSAWPNAAFDLVGICCGQLNVPFMTFFTATLIGKAVIKVNGQAAFFVWWFRNPEVVISFAVSIVESLPVGVLPLSAIDVETKMNQALKQVSMGKTNDDGSPSMLKLAGNYLVFSVIGYFAYSCISQFAQEKQREYDDALIENYRKTGSKTSKSKTE